jgi:hypothetical protein
MLLSRTAHLTEDTYATTHTLSSCPVPPYHLSQLNHLLEDGRRDLYPLPHAVVRRHPDS